MPSDGDKRPSKGWKEHLLRSGVPLEYEIALTMASEGLAVEADFSFFRRDISGPKECSVDIDATWYGQGRNTVGFALHILAECKYRSPDKRILCFEEPATEFPTPTLGGTVRHLDVFVPYSLPANSLVALEENYRYVYKIIEIFEKGAYDEELRHGIQQLRYATPVSLRSIFDFEIFGRFPPEAMVHFFTKVLVTNAPLLILRPWLGIEAIKSASSVEDISTAAKTVILYSDYGPDFADHFRSTFKDGHEDRTTRAAAIAEHLVKSGKKFRAHEDPITLLQSFVDAQRFECRAVSTQFFVTTLDGLPPLLNALKLACRNSYAKRTKVPQRHSSASRHRRPVRQRVSRP